MKYLVLIWLAFLIPSFTAHSQTRKVLEQAKPWLGISIDDHVKGALVKEVMVDTPADKFGIKSGDIITKIDGKKISNAKGLVDEIGIKGVGVSVTVELLRQEKYLTKKLGLEARPDDMEVPNLQLKDKPAPTFKLKTAYGKASGNLSDHKGKVVLLQFWATWCPACRMTHDALSKVAKKLAPQGLVVLAISSEDAKLINSHLTKTKAEFSALADVNGEIESKYFVPALPTMVLIDRQGVVKRVSVGGGKYFIDILNEAIKLL